MILMAKFDDGGRRGNNVDATATAISVSITCAVSYYKLNKNTTGKTVASMMIVVSSGIGSGDCRQGKGPVTLFYKKKYLTRSPK